MAKNNKEDSKLKKNTKQIKAANNAIEKINKELTKQQNGIHKINNKLKIQTKKHNKKALDAHKKRHSNTIKRKKIIESKNKTTDLDKKTKWLSFSGYKKIGYKIRSALMQRNINSLKKANNNSRIKSSKLEVKYLESKIKTLKTKQDTLKKMDNFLTKAVNNKKLSGNKVFNAKKIAKFSSNIQNEMKKINNEQTNSKQKRKNYLNLIKLRTKHSPINRPKNITQQIKALKNDIKLNTHGFTSSASIKNLNKQYQSLPIKPLNDGYQSLPLNEETRNSQQKTSVVAGAKPKTQNELLSIAGLSAKEKKYIKALFPNNYLNNTAKGQTAAPKSNKNTQKSR